MSRLLRSIAFSASTALVVACAEAGAPGPLAPGEVSRTHSASATLLECPTDRSDSTSMVIDVSGGTLKLTDSFKGTHEVVFPANAVTLPTKFSLKVPAGQYVKVRVVASDPLTGETKSVTFPADAQPTLAVSYKRCTRNNTASKPLSLYNVDPSSNHILEGPFGAKEGNTSDPRVVGKVPHFSDYAVGSPD